MKRLLPLLLALAAVVALGMVLWIVMGLSGDLGSPEVWQR